MKILVPWLGVSVMVVRESREKLCEWMSLVIALSAEIHWSLVILQQTCQITVSQGRFLHG